MRGGLRTGACARDTSAARRGGVTMSGARARDARDVAGREDL